MKKIFLTLTLVAGFIATAQVKIGTNPTVIDANSLLELESTTQGLLYPRVSLTSTTSYEPLIAVNPLTLLVEKQAGMTVYNTATTTTGTNDVTPGLYVNDGFNWIRVTPAAKNLYTDNGTLTGARTVTQNNNDLTFTTGTAKTIVDGNFKTKSIYGKVVNIGAALTYTVLSDDYMIVSEATSVITLPAAASNAGRIIIVVNNKTAAGTVTVAGDFQFAYTMTLTVGKGKHYFSDGSKWFSVSYN
jgi:hypothetical protein